MMFEPVLRHYPELRGQPTPLTDGLINDTFAVGEAHILQRLHPIFSAEVNLDIAALTKPLRSAGVPVPSVVPSRSGTLWATVEGHSDAVDGVWRVLTRLPGRTCHHVASLEQARSAGAMLERFHRALIGVEHTFAFSRPGAHDTDHHMMLMEQAVAEHKSHRLYEELAPLAEAIREGWSTWGTVPNLTSRIMHGDPKISNFLFDSSGSAVVGVVDLDTMAWSSVDIELGDALRSWCSTARSESSEAVRFDLDVFEHAMAGYLAQGRSWLSAEEIASFSGAAERICLELAARFAADTLRESYFRHDPNVAPTRGAHNLLRTRNQWALARDIARKSSEIKQRLYTLIEDSSR